MSKIFFYINIPTFLVTILPFLLITGSFLSDLAISICALIFVINSYNNSLRSYYNNLFFKYFLLFWLILILSSIASNHVAYSLFKSVVYIRFILFSLCFWFLLDSNKNLLKYLFYSFSFCFSILLIDGFVQFFLGSNMFGWPIIDTRISSFFKDELILGSYLSRLFPIFFAIMVFLNEKKKNNFLVFFVSIIFILSDVIIFLSGERSALFYLNLSTLFIIIFTNGYKKIRFIGFSISIFLMIIISTYQPQYAKRVVQQTLTQFHDKLNDDKNNEKIYFFSKEHEDHYKSAILMFLDNKFLGKGPNGFKKNCHLEKYRTSFESCSTHPHNTYLQLLAETGIAGFSSVLFLFILIIYFSLRNFYLQIFLKKKLFNDFQIVLFSSFLISLWPLIPTGNFFGNWIGVVYYLPLGIFLWSLEKTKNNF